MCTRNDERETAMMRGGGRAARCAHRACSRVRAQTARGLGVLALREASRECTLKTFLATAVGTTNFETAHWIRVQHTCN